MKRLLLIFIVLSTMSCSVMKYEPKFTMGMAELEFRELNKAAIPVYGDDKGTKIYRTMNLYGAYKFFVFDKEKLVKFEEGTAPDDYKYIAL